MQKPDFNYDINLFIQTGNCKVLDYFHEAIYIVDGQGNYVYANLAARAYSDLTLEELVTRNTFHIEEYGVYLDVNPAARALEEKKRVVTTSTVHYNGMANPISRLRSQHRSLYPAVMRSPMSSLSSLQSTNSIRRSGSHRLYLQIRTMMPTSVIRLRCRA